MHIRLESELGETKVEGETLGTVFWPMLSDPTNPYGRYWGIYTDPPGVIALGQGWARYQMNGETATGLCERSNFPDRLHD
jgi:hypothetical protein